MSVPLTKVDSAVAGLSLDDKPPAPSEKEVKKTHKRTSSTSAPNVWNIKDLGMPLTRSSLPHHFITNIHPEEQKIEIELPIETQKTGW